MNQDSTGPLFSLLGVSGLVFAIALPPLGLTMLAIWAVWARSLRKSFVGQQREERERAMRAAQEARFDRILRTGFK